MVVFCDFLRQLAPAIATERIGAVEEQYLDELCVLLAGGFVQQSAARLDGLRLGGQLGGIDVDNVTDVIVGKNIFKSTVVGRLDEVLDPVSSSLDEDGASELQKLEDFGAAGEVERRLSLEVSDRLVDLLLVEK